MHLLRCIHALPDILYVEFAKAFHMRRTFGGLLVVDSCPGHREKQSVIKSGFRQQTTWLEATLLSSRV